MIINNFDYEEARRLDKRTFVQYYISLLKIKHILFFSFCITKDYNSQTIKIYIFFLTFAINYLVSAMFYSDKTMHKIYKDEGSFDFAYQLPQMIYSLIISVILKNLLNYLGLYEIDIISFKNEKKRDSAAKEKVLHKIRCKIFLFFISTYLFLFFFWFYLGCFCAVYKNTQIHLFIDVLSSFGLSFITPFFINLLPGIFRIPSLNKNVNRPLMYKFSKLLQIF